MCYAKLIFCQAVTLVLIAPHALTQEPQVDTARNDRPAKQDIITAAAITGAKQDAAAVARGSNAFRTYCAGCHGPAANGGPGAPDLVRSLIVLDDENGSLIGPVLREGRPNRGMPKLNLTEGQIADLIAWLHVRTYAAGHRGTYAFQNVLTGNPKKGEIYFNSTGECHSCHSVKGDLAGIGSKYDAFSLQTRWLQPRSARRGGRRAAGASPGTADNSARMVPTVTVTLPSGQSFSGRLDHIDDFTVSLRDSNNQFHSFARDGEIPRVEIHDPLKAHLDLLSKYTDADIHNVTAYLATLK